MDAHVWMLRGLRLARVALAGAQARGTEIAAHGIVVAISVLSLWRLAHVHQYLVDRTRPRRICVPEEGRASFQELGLHGANPLGRHRPQPLERVGG